jgi:tRNA(Ile)-lysidine synthase
MSWNFGTLFDSCILDSEPRIVLALSGGPDSIYLFYTLLRAKKNNNTFSFCTAHFNHKLRDEADEEAEFVKKLSEKYDILHFQTEGDVISYSKEHKKGLEESARILRYNYLNQVVREYNGDFIFLGHHMDDQVETILFNMIRGTGLTGLVGIRERNGLFIRPLLNIKKEEIISLLDKEGYIYCIDKTNNEIDYTRNKIRHLLLPLWNEISCKEYPNSIVRLGKIAEETESYIKYKAKEFINEFCFVSFNFILCKIDELKKEHISLRKEVYRLAIEKINGNLTNIKYSNLENIDNILINNRHGLCFQLNKKCFAEIAYDNLYIYKKNKNKYVSKELSLGENIINTSLGDMSIFLKIVDKRKNSNKYTQYIDLDKIDGPIKCRFKNSKDVFKPIGFNGSKKMKNYFNEVKIPVFLRNGWPLISDNVDILWVCNHRIADKVKVRNDSKKILEINIKNII